VNWIQAEASIKKNTVVVQAESVKLPKGVRFGYHNNSNPNLFNAAGLPASCFEILF
jgi:sialate O-acetylesterase